MPVLSGAPFWSGRNSMKAIWNYIKPAVMALCLSYLVGFGALLGAHVAGKLVGVAIVIGYNETGE